MFHEVGFRIIYGFEVFVYNFYKVWLQGLICIWSICKVWLHLVYLQGLFAISACLQSLMTLSLFARSNFNFLDNLLKVN
jgi:hypothetical protein